LSCKKLAFGTALALSLGKVDRNVSYSKKGRGSVRMSRSTVTRILRIVFLAWLVVTALIVWQNSVIDSQKHRGDAKTSRYWINRGENKRL
jgi:hypothetical protein